MPRRNRIFAVAALTVLCVATSLVCIAIYWDAAQYGNSLGNRAKSAADGPVLMLGELDLGSLPLPISCPSAPVPVIIRQVFQYSCIFTLAFAPLWTFSDSTATARRTGTISAPDDSPYSRWTNGNPIPYSSFHVREVKPAPKRVSPAIVVDHVRPSFPSSALLVLSAMPGTDMSCGAGAFRGRGEKGWLG
eukprot:2840398-Rhodomonas_salina.2